MGVQELNRCDKSSKEIIDVQDHEKSI